MMPDGTMQMMPLDRFEPTPEMQRRFRDGLGCFASGVTVVTAATPQGGVGMTANSFSSVSLEPPLILWCPAKGSNRYDIFSTAPHFAIHVLHAGQKDLALDFARTGDAFAGLALETTAEGVPVFSDCLARFECKTRAVHDAGDHSIVVGQVTAAAFREGHPLIFSRGAFGRFDKQA